MAESLHNKIAVVTGAGRGLGQRVACHLAQRGAHVAIAARSEHQLHETAQRIDREGGRSLIVPMDVSQPEQVEQLRQTVETKLGPPVILINAAGVFGPIQLIKDSDTQQWIETFATNTIGPYLTCRAFMGKMIEAGWGRIINFSSAATLHPPAPLNSAYATSKVALNQFTRHLASELENTGVTANVIHPGEVKTAMWQAIRDQVANVGHHADPFRQWVKDVEKSGGDPPKKTLTLIDSLIDGSNAIANGQFLWIEDGIQTPIDSW